MRRYGWAVGLAGFVVAQAALAEPGSFQFHMDQEQVTIRAEGVELGQILEALRERTGILVLIGDDWAGQPVSLVLDAKGAEEAIWELLLRTGRRNYVIVYQAVARQFEASRFADGSNRTLNPATQPPSAPRLSRGRTTPSVVVPQGSLVPPLPPSDSGTTFQLPPSFRRPAGGEVLDDRPPSRPRRLPPVSVRPRGTLVPSFPPSPDGPRFYLPPSFRPLHAE